LWPRELSHGSPAKKKKESSDRIGAVDRISGNNTEEEGGNRSVLNSDGMFSVKPRIKTELQR
jgi:hypothetical protein